MRILCAAISGPGHLFPVLAVAGELHARGHDVTVATMDDCERFVRQTPMRFVALPPATWERDRPFEPYALAKLLAIGTMPLLEQQTFDAALVDGLCLGVALACEANGVPWATIYPHPLPFASRDLAPYGSGRVVRRGPLGRWRDARARARQEIDFAKARQDCNAVRAGLGLSVRDDAVPSSSADLILVAAPAALEPPRSDWPPHAFVVGPCPWDPAPSAPDEDGGPASDARPTVLVASSTSHDDPLARAAVDAAARLGARVVVTASGPSSERVTFAGFAPHAALLRGADAVVCNAGGGILGKAMSAGVPVVAVPHHGDQKENAARAERLGVAIVAGDALSIEVALRRALVDPRFRDAAAAVSEAIERDGPLRAAEMIERWAEERVGGKTKGGGLTPAPLPNGGF